MIKSMHADRLCSLVFQGYSQHLDRPLRQWLDNHEATDMRISHDHLLLRNLQRVSRLVCPTWSRHLGPSWNRITVHVSFSEAIRPASTHQASGTLALSHSSTYKPDAPRNLSYRSVDLATQTPATSHLVDSRNRASHCQQLLKQIRQVCRGEKRVPFCQLHLQTTNKTHSQNQFVARNGCQIWSHMHPQNLRKKTCFLTSPNLYPPNLLS